MKLYFKKASVCSGGPQILAWLASHLLFGVTMSSSFKFCAQAKDRNEVGLVCLISHGALAKITMQKSKRMAHPSPPAKSSGVC